MFLKWKQIEGECMRFAPFVGSFIIVSIGLDDAERCNVVGHTYKWDPFQLRFTPEKSRLLRLQKVYSYWVGRHLSSDESRCWGGLAGAAAAYSHLCASHHRSLLSSGLYTPRWVDDGPQHLVLESLDYVSVCLLGTAESVWPNRFELLTQK